MINNGVFPTNAVYETIDGLKTIPAHGTREMPIWGERFNPIINLPHYVDPSYWKMAGPEPGSRRANTHPRCYRLSESCSAKVATDGALSAAFQSRLVGSTCSAFGSAVMYCGVPQRQQLAPIRQDNRIIEPHSSVGKLNQLCELSTIGGIEHETAMVPVAARWH